MAVWTRKEAAQHWGHKLKLETYGSNPSKPDSVTIECDDCNEVLVAFEDLEEEVGL